MSCERHIIEEADRRVSKHRNGNHVVDITESGYIDFYKERASLTELSPDKRSEFLEEDPELTCKVEHEVRANLKCLKALTSDSDNFVYEWSVTPKGKLRLATYYVGNRSNCSVKPRVRWENY